MEWISVKDRLPELKEHEYLIVMSEKGNIRFDVKYQNTGFSFGDGTNITATGVLGVITVKNACTIAAWSLHLVKFDTGSTSTTTLDMWVSTSATPTVSNTIMGTKPTLAAGSRTGVVTTGISGWTSAGARPSAATAATHWSQSWPRRSSPRARRLRREARDEPRGIRRLA